MCNQVLIDWLVYESFVEWNKGFRILTNETSVWIQQKNLLVSMLCVQCCAHKHSVRVVAKILSWLWTQIANWHLYHVCTCCDSQFMNKTVVLASIFKADLWTMRPCQSGTFLACTRTDFSAPMFIENRPLLLALHYIGWGASEIARIFWCFLYFQAKKLPTVEFFFF